MTVKREGRVRPLLVSIAVPNAERPAAPHAKFAAVRLPRPAGDPPPTTPSSPWPPPRVATADGGVLEHLAATKLQWTSAHRTCGPTVGVDGGSRCVSPIRLRVAVGVGTPPRLITDRTHGQRPLRCTLRTWSDAKGVGRVLGRSTIVRGASACRGSPAAPRTEGEPNARIFNELPTTRP